jgi:flagellar hook-associated protein 1 FlgK
MSDNEDVLTHQLDSQRLEVMGVSSEEELSNMIKYQQAYNASSRYVNVIDSMLQTLIMQMGAG